MLHTIRVEFYGLVGKGPSPLLWTNLVCVIVDSI